ncbi:MAG TPA: hypothetical protein VML94_04250 [Thermoplasmata archaeon]|nr:hypothetical protein [Thermoplasmata archaeon]
MKRFRGSDETLDREIAQVERIARLRLARAAAEMRALERDLRELRRERARRRGAVAEPMDETAADEAVA